MGGTLGKWSNKLQTIKAGPSSLCHFLDGLCCDQDALHSGIITLAGKVFDGLLWEWLEVPSLAGTHACHTAKYG